MALKLAPSLMLIMALACIISKANTLPLKKVTGFEELARRLEQGGGTGGMVECWNALMELKSCSNEIIIFFLNGQTEIGPGCCKAIDIITRHCWSSMLTSLGFTAEEGNVLVGYCDNAAASYVPGPVASPPKPQVLAPEVVKA